MRQREAPGPLSRSGANSYVTQLAAYLRWLRTFFDIDESRLRARLYLHEGLDEAEAVVFWSELTAIPTEQFNRSYRPVARQGYRNTTHRYGCVAIRYHDRSMQRRVIALMEAVASFFANPG